MSTSHDRKLSSSFTCSECGGCLKIVDEGNTDASAWEKHECTDCGGEGEFYISEGTKRDGGQITLCSTCGVAYPDGGEEL